MKPSFPTPSEIFEELAEKTATQIERLAPVAFDAAWNEMTRYHRFLLALNAAQTQDGKLISYAEVAGNFWHAPHQEWIRQYVRVFERAANRLPDDSHFLRSVAYAPNRLMQVAGTTELSSGVINSILGLGPMMMHQVQNWITKRRTVEASRLEGVSSRVALAGSDAKSYEGVLPHIVGAWESLFSGGTAIRRIGRGAERNEHLRWDAVRASWPFAWGHLYNTAYCLAIAVWNDDEAGANIFREALVRWPQGLTLHSSGYTDLQHEWLLFPDVLALEWPEAISRYRSLARAYAPSVSPEVLFQSILNQCHNDVVVVTASLLLYWTSTKKKNTDIGARTASALLRQEAGDREHYTAARRYPEFHSMFWGIMRLSQAGHRFARDSYGNSLDEMIQLLDRMTERQVVPGRVFTPTTLHGRHELLLSMTAILLAWTPDDINDELLKRIAEIARQEEILPSGDESLRVLIQQLGEYQTTIDQSLTEVSSAVAMLAPSQLVELAAPKLQAFISSALSIISAQRIERLKAKPIDNAKLERLRVAMETALLGEPAPTPFFRGVQIVGNSQVNEQEWCQLNIGKFNKASFVDPPMETVSSNLDEVLVSNIRMRAGQCAWGDFTRRSRTVVNQMIDLQRKKFWEEIKSLIETVGPDPVLLVSRKKWGRILWDALYDPNRNADQIRIVNNKKDLNRNFYIATVEDVDVFGVDFPDDEAWLFSGRSLQRIVYMKTPDIDRYVDISMEFDEHLEGVIRIRFRQATQWSSDRVFELNSPARICDDC
jgi:hypothetical protein